jgi:hypothetical protein
MSRRDRTTAEQKTLLFLHIPKTAGTTLNRIIEQQFNPLRIYTLEGMRVEWSIGHFKRMSEHRRAWFRAIKGHLSFGFDRYVPRPSAYITFLRDPVERSISAYYYEKERVRTAFHRRVKRENLDVLTFLDLTPWDNNLQCKMLAGVDREICWPRAAAHAAAKPGAPVPKGDFDSFSNAQTLERAKTNLAQNIAFLGLAERFAESLVLLKHLFGWNLTSYSNFNQSRSRPPREKLDAHTRAAIEKHNEYDMVLYEFAQQLFAQSLARSGLDIASEAAELRVVRPTGFAGSIRRYSSLAFRLAASRMVSLP